ncbi:hypothetical protein KR044_003720, partial [Drosophila immigrans]
SCRRVPQTLLLICAAVALAQNDGRYRPDPKPAANVRARSGNNDGRYVAGNAGRYSGGNDGRYVHQDNKYEHDNRPGGDYTGSNNPYINDKNRFGGQGRGGGAGGGQNANGASGANGSSGGGRPAIKQPRPTVARVAPVVVDQRPNLPQGTGTGIGKGGFAIIRQEGEVQADGYNYLYETENGILGEESGRIEKQTEGDAIRSQGFYHYTGDDGLLYRVDYLADENGFVPVGEHIPKVPDHIPRLLAYLKEKG